jgi:hypothetical protein
MTRKKAYLLSGGIVPLLENRYKFSLDEPTKDNIREVEHDYFLDMNMHLHGRKDKDDNGKFEWDLKFFTDLAINRSMREVVAAHHSNRPLISFDDVYCTDLADGKYHITRINDPFDLDKKPLHGPRLGYKKLEDQVRDIKRIFGNEIDVLDIGVFEGETLISEAEGRFKNAGVSIKNVYTAFASKTSAENLKNRGMSLYSANAFDWVDWLELRDCLGFDGRKVIWEGEGEKPNGFFIRYDKKPSWASIPRGMEGKFTELYDKYFNKIRKYLKDYGIHADLIRSKHPSGNIHELRIKPHDFE